MANYIVHLNVIINTMGKIMNTHDVFKNYKNIAVLGMSNNPAKPSHTVPAFIHRQGYNIIPINPNANEILDLKAYNDVKTIPEKIEVLNVFRPSGEAVKIVEEAIERKKEKNDIDVIWLQLGIVNDEAKQLAEENGIGFIQDKCMYIEYNNYRKANQ